jgi:addiction module HigA family antidote
MISGVFALSGKMATHIMWRSLIIIDDLELLMSTRQIGPIHPGEILLEEFLIPMEISQYRLAKDINVDPRRINEIVLGKRSISADTALRLARYFGSSERFWLNLQSRYDLELQKDLLGDRLIEEVKVRV